jgi:spermidine synthase
MRRTLEGATELFIGELALTAAAVFVPAVFMGMALPLLVAGVQGPNRFARVGRVYAANTFGCLAAPFLVGFVLIPGLGIHATLGLLLAVCILVGLAARVPRLFQPWSAGATAETAVALVLLAGLAAGWGLLPRQYTKSPVRAPRQLLYYCEGDNATVAVVCEPSGARCIMVDGQPVAGTSKTSMVDQKMLAHLPLLLHPRPRRALTVGFGSGGTSYSMTLHGVEVDCVEIEAAVAAAAPLFESENHGVRGHPHFRLILDDARSWLRVAPVRYDAIVTDCTNLQYRSNGDLYTADYFRLMKARLRDGGLAAAWVPANGIREDDLKTLLRSFRAVFAHTSVWYMNVLPTDFLIVVGTPGPLCLDVEQLRARMSRPGVAEDLTAVGLTDPCRLLTTLLSAGAQLDAYLGTGALNSDDRPVLSYSTYGEAHQNTIAKNLLGLMGSRVDVEGFVRHAPAGTALLRCRAASNEALLGHVRYHLGDPRAALRHYLDGCRLLPDDRALHELLRDTYTTLVRH